MKYKCYLQLCTTYSRVHSLQHTYCTSHWLGYNGNNFQYLTTIAQMCQFIEHTGHARNTVMDTHCYWHWEAGWHNTRWILEYRAHRRHGASLLTFLQLGETLGVVPCEWRISQLKGVLLLRRGVIVEVKCRQVLSTAWSTEAPITWHTSPKACTRSNHIITTTHIQMDRVQ